MMKYDIFSSKYMGIEAEPVNAGFEKLDMTMQKGYEYEMSGNTAQAVACWDEVFVEIKAYFADHQLKDLKTFDDIYNGTQYVENWVQDYDDALNNLFVQIGKKLKVEVGKQKLDLLNFLLGLNQSKELMAQNKRSLAETYFLLGRPEEGEQQFIQLIEDNPDDVWGYIGFSDEYWMEYSNCKDFEKALRILTKAYNRITIPESDIIVERLAKLTVAMQKKELEDFLALEKKFIVTDDTTIVEAINCLKVDSSVFPFACLEFLESNQQAAEPLILEEMKTYLKDPDQYGQSNGLLSVYLPYILGQWERKASSRDVIELVACSEDSIDLRIGYSITEEYPVVLYKCFDGDVDYLQSVISRKDVGEYPKLAYLKALAMYYVEDLKDIEGLKAYLEKLLVEQPKLATWISDVVIMINQEELLSIAEKAVKSKYYNPDVNGDWPEYQMHFNSGLKDETSWYKEPFNVIENFRYWSQFREERPVVPEYATLYQKLFNLREEKIRNSGKNNNEKKFALHQMPVVKGKKIGRNEPCPCGSGKKYKKCCGK